MNLLLIEDHADIAANITEYFEGRGDGVVHVVDGTMGLQKALADRTTRSFWTCCCRGSTVVAVAASCAMRAHAGSGADVTARTCSRTRSRARGRPPTTTWSSRSRSPARCRSEGVVRRARLPVTPRVPQRRRSAFRSRYARSRARRRAPEAQHDDAELADRPAQNSHRVVTRAEPSASCGATRPRRATSCAPTCTRCAPAIDKNFPEQAPAHDPWHRLSTLGRNGSFVV